MIYKSSVKNVEEVAAPFPLGTGHVISYPRLQPLAVKEQDIIRFI
jgi:hypothetical protein